jgi:RimJ/RimL family protein N-acetyltransferase
MELEKVKITAGNNHLINEFLQQAGRSLEQFRYFSKRPVSVWRNHVCTFLFLQNNIPVCYGHLDKDGDKIWLGIAVAESETGKGHGKKMMKELIAEAKEQRLSLIYLTVDTVNSKAIKLYENFGFKLVSKQESYLEYYLEIQ